jgi:arylsulfatase A
MLLKKLIAAPRKSQLCPMKFASAFATVCRGLLIAAFPALNTAQAQPADPLPNIVLIFTDDQGYSDVGCFGAKGLQTPHLDRMAREGRRFTSFHVSSPVCSASRAALLTGCYHSRVGIHGALGPAAKIGLHPDEMTLAELLKSKNYATAIFGKWHLGRPLEFLPMRQGFDEYFGLPYSNDMWPKHPEAERGTYPPLPLIDGERVIEEMPDQNQLTARYTERAVSFIERNQSRPFLLYLAHSMPHVPLHVSDKFRGQSQRGLYGDVIEEIDWSVGQVLEALKRGRLDDRTLVIFTSDNGPWLSYGEHAGSANGLREGKGTCFEGGTRVPCLMRWPGKIPAGTICDEPLMTIDLFPTIARLTGAPLPTRKIDGRDAWPLIAGEPGARCPQEAYFFYFQDNQLQAVLSGSWKLMLPHDYRTLGEQPKAQGGIPVKYRSARIDAPQLFDLSRDQAEANDVAAAHPDVLGRLLGLVEQMRGELGDSLAKRQGVEGRPPGRKQ